MSSRFKEWFGHIADHLSVWPVISAIFVTSTASFSAYLTAATEWLNQFGAMAWFIAALVGALLSATLCILIAMLRHLWIRATLIAKWAEKSDRVNPLLDEFSRERIDLNEIVDPTRRLIKNKRFSRCEIVGRSNIILTGNSILMNTTMHNCDLVVISPRAKRIMNAIELRDVHVVECGIFDCTILISQNLLDTFIQMRAEFISLTGRPEIDAVK